MKIAHIAHFLHVDLDISFSAVTYPGGSYINVARRAMPLLNIAMSGVSLPPGLMQQPVYESQIKSARTMEDICTAVAAADALKSEIQQSIQSCIKLLEDKYARVECHSELIVLGNLATEGDMSDLFEEVPTCLDTTLTSDETTNDQIDKRKP